MIFVDSNVPMFLVGLDDVQAAKELLLGRYGISARGAIHAAVMRTHRIERIASFDAGFDRLPGVERLR